jgi:hypothetical protein
MPQLLNRSTTSIPKYIAGYVAGQEAKAENPPII